jgi:hypothetical protein
MKAPRLASLAAVAAAFLYLGSLPAAAEPAGVGDGIRPVMAPPAAHKKVSARRSSRPTARQDVHVYLFRGLLNVFSLGMDELADKIHAMGIAATVYNHTEWEEVAAEIAAKYKAGNHAPIILIGHSLGADAVMFMAASLGKRGVPVALVVPFDGTQTLVASSNVARVINLTQRDYAYARKGYGFHGELKNIDVSGEGVDHLNIDKSPRLHALVLSNIAAIVKKGETPSSFATVSPEEKEHAAPLPKPAPADVAAKPEPAQEKAPTVETAAKPQPGSAAPAAEVAAKPAEEPKIESAPALRPAEAVPPAAPVAPATAAVSPPVPPANVPEPPAQTASAPAPAVQPISAPAASAPRPVSAEPVPAKPIMIPAPDRLEYEKLVLPKH